VVAFGLANSAVVCFDRAFVSEAFVIPTRGMSPTLEPGDRILVDKLWYRRREVHRNDLVVFRSQGPNSPLFVQRVVGLPGDDVEVRNERVLINGVQWDDPHAVFDGPLPPLGPPADYGPAKIPADCCFLLGDNRRMSKDSRFLGPIPLSDIYGIARIIYWSRERTFLQPYDPEHYVSGPIRWDRIGIRLD
jgi:signal peptidase I